MRLKNQGRSAMRRGMPTERQLTVMFTDMKGYTARSARSSSGELLQMLKEHDQVVLPILELRGGKLIKTIGDALMMTYVNPVNAVQAAAEVQEALLDYNIGREKDERIDIRIGIHFGTLTEVDGDLFGNTVNIAARVEGIAKPGTVYFTEAVMRELKPDTCDTLFMGEQKLKGVPIPIGIYKVAVEGKRAQWEARYSALRHSKAARIGSFVARAAGVLSLSGMLGLGVIIGSYQLVLAAVVGMLSLAPSGWGTLSKLRPLLAAVAGALVFTSMSGFISDTQQHLDDLSAQLQDEGPDSISGVSAAGVYAVSMGSAAMQLLLDPGGGHPATVAARLRWGMLSEHKKRVRMQTDFAMGSPRVIRPLSALTYRLGKRGSTQNMGSKSIDMRGDRLFDGLPVWRLAMAARSKKSHNKWRIYVVADAKVAYGLGERAILIDHGSWFLKVDTGLVMLLQNRGWLKPYRARLEWSVSADDRRFTDHQTIGLK